VRSPPPRSLLADESGAAAAEYALVVGAIAGVIVLIVFAFGAKLNNLYSHFTW
jgi:Flp pilus assembly pilin Flp